MLARRNSSLVTLGIIILLALFSIPNRAQQPKVLAPHRPVAPRITKRFPLPPPVSQSATGGLWMIGANFKASLYLTNGLKTDPLTVTPALYLGNGVRYALDPVTLEPSGTAVIDIAQELAKQGVAPYATLSGYAEISYNWPWAPVCATVRNVDLVHSLIFIYTLKPLAEATTQSDKAHTFEGMWWKQESNVSGFIGLSNVTGRAITANVQVSDNTNHNLAAHTVTVSPHGTKIVELNELLPATTSTGGITIAHDGPMNGLAINGGLQDETTGYSAHLYISPSLSEPLHVPPRLNSFTPPPQLNQATTLTELGLMTGAADPMMNFPAGTVFTPYSVLRNISDQPLVVTPTLWWMQGTARSASLAQITIAPHQTQSLDVLALLKAAGLNNLNGSVNLVLDVNGNSRGLLAASGSVDQRNNYVFEVIPRGVLESASKSLPYWSTGNGDDTMVTLWNPADEAQGFVFTLFYTGGHYAHPIHLEPRATQTFNVSEIIRTGTPDAEGNVIPADVKEGSAEISGSQGDNEHILVAMDAGTYNVRKAICGQIYCQSCNGVNNTSVIANPFAVAVNGQTQQTFYEIWNTGAQYDHTSNSTWSSNNTSVATVHTGLINGVSLGSANVGAADNFTQPQSSTTWCEQSQWNCPLYTTTPTGSGPGNTITLTCAPSSVTRGSSTTCTVNNAPSGAAFSNWKFTDANSNTVTRSGNNNVSSWSGTIITGGTMSVTVSGGANPTATATISVTNRSWHTNPASPTEVANGTFLTLPVPPAQSGLDSGLGAAAYQLTDTGFNITTINDSGPNSGYSYYASALNFSVSYFDYEINPDLENTSSTFYLAQCGNYNATTNPNGFISGANLLAQTRRHEYNSTTQSHYAFYSNSLNRNNPGDYFESRVAPPGANLTTFNNDTRTGINNRYSTVTSDTAVEPYPVNYSETGVPLGNVNYSPYTPCQ